MSTKALAKKVWILIMATVILVASFLGAFYYYGYMSAKPVLSSEEAKFGVHMDILTFDPHLNVLVTQQSWLNHVYDRLLYQEEVGGSMTYAPALAESWEMYNETYYLFHLRHGVLFHSGRELTADDVVWTLERATLWNNITVSTRYVFGPLNHFKAIDKYTVLIGSDQPYGAFLSALSCLYAEIIDSQAGGKVGFGLDFDGGTGPYKLVEKVKGEYSVLERFDDYWDRNNHPAYFKKITVQTITDDEARVMALETGAVDMISNPPPASIGELQDKGFVIDSIANSRNVFYRLNCEKSPTDNVKVRLAMNYAVDKKAICQTILMGVTKPDDGYDHAGVFGRILQASAVGEPVYPYDPDKARALLAESGYLDNPIPLYIISSNRHMEERKVADSVRAYLEAVGFRVSTLTIVEWNSFLTQQQAKKNQWADGTDPATFPENLAIASWMCVTADEDYTFRGSISGSPTLAKAGCCDWGYYDNPRIDELTILASSTLNISKRQEYYAEGQKILYDDVPFLLLHCEPTLHARVSNLKGVSYYLELVSLRDAYMD
jgi:ABC-type transport system substrate-binding protein